MTNSIAINSTITMQQQATNDSPLEAKDSTKNEMSISIGFQVAKGSDITPCELKAAGVVMQNFVFFLPVLTDLKACFNQYDITDISTSLCPIYLFSFKAGKSKEEKKSFNKVYREGDRKINPLYKEKA
ncbi:hypothetical protein [Photobacterium indicum]|uniref:hypothetical protein n=1 Tax=Photobacterium indicum TaxID=81447 RepID=UPI003D09CDEE